MGGGRRGAARRRAAARRASGRRSTPDPFEMLVGAITAQQVSLFSARRDPQPADRALRRCRSATALGVPDARAARGARPRTSSFALGFSRRKAEYVVGLARSELDLDALAALPDDEVKARLVALRGLGEWTADWFLARHLARPHAWPWGDLALRKAVARSLWWTRRPGGARALPPVREPRPPTTSCSRNASRDPPRDPRRPPARPRALAARSTRRSRTRRGATTTPTRTSPSSSRRSARTSSCSPSDDGSRSARGRREEGRRGSASSTSLYVRPDGAAARRRGASSCARPPRSCASSGAEVLELEVLASNARRARGLRALGLRARRADARRADRRARRAARRAAKGPTFGSIHVQTDDVGAVERAVQQGAAAARALRAARRVSAPTNGWVAVHDELCDRDPKLLQRLAKELSYASGGVVLAIGVEDGAVVRYTLFDRGGAVDEYASRAGVLTARCRPATSSRSARTRRSSHGSPAPTPRACARSRARRRRLPSCRRPLELLAQIADVDGRRRGDARVGGLMLTLYDAARCPYCARVRIVLAEKDVEYEAIEIDLSDRPAWIYEKNTHRPRAGGRGGRLAAAGVGRDHGVPRGALPRACAPRRGSRRPRARAALDLPPRRLHEARTTRCGAARTAPRRASTRSSTSSTPRSPCARGSAAASTGSPTSRTCRGCSARATCSASRSTRYPAVTAWLDRLLERPAVAAEAEVVAALSVSRDVAA